MEGEWDPEPVGNGSPGAHASTPESPARQGAEPGPSSDNLGYLGPRSAAMPGSQRKKMTPLWRTVTRLEALRTPRRCDHERMNYLTVTISPAPQESKCRGREAARITRQMRPPGAHALGCSDSECEMDVYKTFEDGKAGSCQ